MATEGTKFQINYKLNDGTLINLYAASVQELEAGLADLAMNAANIRTTGAELTGYIAPPAATAPTVASVAAAFGGTPVAAPAAAPAGGNTCRHGVMALREGTSARGPWKGYMCAAPKGATDKCDTIWIR
jgi:hypothetical protein